MRVLGLGPLELIFCCIPLFVVLGVALFLSLSRNPTGVHSQAPQPPSTMLTPGPPPGWYADPLGNHETRYWDGMKWTEHVADGGVGKVDPL
jgi:hypothetical protein